MYYWETGNRAVLFSFLQPSVRTALDIRDSPNYSGCFNLFFPAKDLSHHILLSTVRRPNMICLKVKTSNCNNLQNYKNVKRYQFSISNQKYYYIKSRYRYLTAAVVCIEMYHSYSSYNI